MNTLAFRRSSSGKTPYLVLIHDAREPDSSEWRAYVEAMSVALGESNRLVHSFIVTDGGGPNAAQRKLLAETLERGPADGLSHIFTTDGVTRGIVTAFRWIARARAVAHLPTDFAKVCEASGHATFDVLDELTKVQATFPLVHTLRTVQEGVQPYAKLA